VADQVAQHAAERRDREAVVDLARDQRAQDRRIGRRTGEVEIAMQRVDEPRVAGLDRERARGRCGRRLSTVDARLGEMPFLAGPALTAADIMAVFSFTTMRLFKPYDLSPWPHVLAWLQRIGARPAYRRAMHKADPGLPPVLGALP
jgi:glutathione S-transferase